MDITSFEDRAKQFIDREIGQLGELNTQVNTVLQHFTDILNQYRETATDLISARKQYIEVLEKYEQTANDNVANPFPGVTSHVPMYSPEQMTSDSSAMKDLAAVVLELQGQSEILENQLQKYLKALVSTTNQTVHTCNQVSGHMEQFLTELSSPYDAGNLGGAVIG